MLILYRVAGQAALAAALVHQAIGPLVPLTGGGIAYGILRQRFDPLRLGAESDAAALHAGARVE